MLERLTPASRAGVSRSALLSLHRATPRRKVDNMAQNIDYLYVVKRAAAVGAALFSFLIVSYLL